MKNKIKLICFDLDGTLLDGTEYIWKTIHDHLGCDHERRNEMKDKYFSGKATYEEWANHDIMLMKEKKATKKTILKAIGKVRLMKNALKTIKFLKKKRYKLAIISGSIDIVLEKAFPKYKEYFNDVFLNKIIFDKKGRLTRCIATKFDMEHKATGMRVIAKREKLKLSECAFVGDNENDIHIAEIAGFTVSFNSKSKKLEKLADVVIRKKDLSEILCYF